MDRKQAIAIAALLVAHACSAHAQYRVFWGAAGGFRYCGDYAPAQAVFNHATQLVAQLIVSLDAAPDPPASPNHLLPGGDDALVDQVTVTPSSGAGSSWGDFVGNVYTSDVPLTGYLYGRLIAQPDWYWYGVFDGPPVDASAGSSPVFPFTYQFNTNYTDDEIGWGYCVACIHPCPEPVLVVGADDTNVVVTYHATDANATYQLEIAHDLTSGVWTATGTNVASGIAQTTNQGPRAYFRVIKE